jgi:hypothetical protein
MSQPQFAEGPPVPLMVEGVIDADTLRRLFAELSAAATIFGVRVKGDPTAYALADEPPPEVALEHLMTGAARAVQVRYRFCNYEWTDTILALPVGFRVVRCRHDSGP